MKKLLVKGISTLLLLALTLTLLSGAALADTVYASAGTSYIRTRPDKSGAVLGTLDAGQSAAYLGSTATDYRDIDWYYISYGGVTGWISSRYTDMVADYSYGNSHSWNVDDCANYFGDHYVIATGGRSYIRSAPGTYAEELTAMPEGDYALYLGEYSYAPNGRLWYKVKYSGITGWVSERYTSLW